MKNKIMIQSGHGQYDSTLLIPERLIPFLEVKIIEFGGLCKLFNFVANAKHPIFNDKPRHGTGKTLYATNGQRLRRVNFRPREEDWERFRVIAQSRRISMCFLFSLILLFWNKFETDPLGVPVTNTKISLSISLTVGPLFTRIHLCRHRI